MRRFTMKPAKRSSRSRSKRRSAKTRRMRKRGGSTCPMCAMNGGWCGCSNKPKSIKGGGCGSCALSKPLF